MTNCSVVCPGVPLSSMFSDYSCAVEVEGTILSTFPLLSIAQVETESFLCVQSIVPCSFFYEIYVFSFCPLMYREIQLLTTQTFLRYKRFFLKNWSNTHMMSRISFMLVGFWIRGGYNNSRKQWIICFLSELFLIYILPSYRGMIVSR